MQKRLWQKIIRQSANPERAAGYLEQFRSTAAAAVLEGMGEEQARILAALLSGSRALSEMLLANPDRLRPLLDMEWLRQPRHKQGLQREVSQWLAPLLDAQDYSAAFARVRSFKQRELLRIAARDLAQLGGTLEVVREISDVADVCLETVYQLCRRQLTGRFGRPYHLDPQGNWCGTAFCVLGMGKLGGQELNYSSDVDVLFVYSEDGHMFKTPPGKGERPGRGLSSHQFFLRLSESFISELSRMTAEGALFRIDLRLRPEGNAGPLARSLASYENYYAQSGQTWERMMLIKARFVAGDSELAAEFLDMIQPFRYPRSLGDRVLREVAAMKRRIENEVLKAGEIERNVKLGRGGIREVEFVTQALQLLHAGRIPFLQSAQTVPTLQKLAQYNLLPQEEADALGRAYCFLRDIEHRLQMEDNRQTHTIPGERTAQTRLAALMGFASLETFETACRNQTGTVRRIYETLLKTDEPPPAGRLPEDFDGFENDWKKLLAERSFRDPEKAMPLVRTFVRGPGYVHVSPRTVELARELLLQLFDACATEELTAKGDRFDAPVLSDPDRVLARLDSFIAAYGARATLYELWTANPSLFKLLLLLFDRSEFLAESAIRTPDLVDELELSGRLRRSKTAEEILTDLRYGLSDDDQKMWLRRYYQAEFMRIGLREILGLADLEQNLLEFSALAEACLQYTLEVVLRKHKFKTAPFCIIGFGKLGGREIIYGSDLDVVFVAKPGTKNLPSLQRPAIELIDLLSAQTEHGSVFAVDARLRPDGDKGLLVNTLDAYESYYRERAMLWEIQSLTRARPVAGNEKLGAAFQKLAAQLTNFSRPDVPQAASRPDWKSEIARMRRRIEKERTPAGKDSLAIKTKSGGLVDAEFIAQAFCLEHGWQEANTLAALCRARDQHVLPPEQAEVLIENYRRLRWVEGILRRWSYAGEILLPDAPAPLYRVAVRCGYTNSAAFMNAIQAYRKAIRSIYKTVFGQPRTS